MRPWTVALLFLIGIGIGAAVGYWLERRVQAPQARATDNPHVSAREAQVLLEQLRAASPGPELRALRQMFAERFPDSWVLKTKAWQAGRVP